MALLDRLPLIWAIGLALTLGLAPFFPEPHLVEKLRMLAEGRLVRPLDMLDLVWHGLPWVLLGAKLLRSAVHRG